MTYCRAVAQEDIRSGQIIAIDAWGHATVAKDAIETGDISAVSAESIGKDSVIEVDDFGNARKYASMNAAKPSEEVLLSRSQKYAGAPRGAVCPGDVWGFNE